MVHRENEFNYIIETVLENRIKFEERVDIVFDSELFVDLHKPNSRDFKSQVEINEASVPSEGLEERKKVVPTPQK